MLRNSPSGRSGNSTQSETLETDPQDVNYANHARGPGKGDSKGGKGPGKPMSLVPYHFAMMLKAMKGDGKVKAFTLYSGTRYSTAKGGKGQGGVKSETRDAIASAAGGIPRKPESQPERLPKEKAKYVGGHV